MIIEGQIKEWGNSFALRISKKKARALGLQSEDFVSANLVKKTTKIDGFGMFAGAKPFKRDPYDFKER